MEIPAYSFLVENETAGKKVLYDLGFMKAWKEKLPPLSEFSTHHISFIPAVSSLIPKSWSSTVTDIRAWCLDSSG